MVDITLENKQLIGAAWHPSEEAISFDESSGSTLWLLPKTMIPDSIFRAFTENRVLAILFFGILTAFALRLQKQSIRNRVMDGIIAIDQLFSSLFQFHQYHHAGFWGCAVLQT